MLQMPTATATILTRIRRLFPATMKNVTDAMVQQAFDRVDPAWADLDTSREATAMDLLLLALLTSLPPVPGDTP